MTPKIVDERANPARRSAAVRPDDSAFVRVVSLRGSATNGLEVVPDLTSVTIDTPSGLPSAMALTEILYWPGTALRQAHVVAPTTSSSFTTPDSFSRST